jgi:protein ImuA
MRTYIEHKRQKQAMTTPRTALLNGLRERLGLHHAAIRHGVLPFGDGRVDDCLAGGGLALGALHEVAATGIEAETGAIAAGFIVCLLARLPIARPIFWIAPNTDLHAPGLLSFGLDPARLIRVQTSDDAQTLAAMEAVLREGAASAVVAEAGRLPRIASRRLQLACLKHGSTGFLLQRWPHGRKAGVKEATASVTQWRLSSAPSDAEHREPGAPRWRVELRHARGGMEGVWIMQAGERDGAHPVRVVAELADHPAAATGYRHAG